VRRQFSRFGIRPQRDLRDSGPVHLVQQFFTPPYSNYYKLYTGV
jgi:hypothetical protein